MTHRLSKNIIPMVTKERFVYLQSIPYLLSEPGIPDDNVFTTLSLMESLERFFYCKKEFDFIDKIDMVLLWLPH
jgi:hypothetical protein